MASEKAKTIVRDVLAAVSARSNEAEIAVALHNVDVELAAIRDVLLDCDSNLSAYGHGRPLTKKDAIELNQRARTLYEKLVIK
jgi:hypothetical protein